MPPYCSCTVRLPVESGIEKRGSRDICQEVCPWNSFATPSSEEAFLAREGLDGPRLIEWMTTMTQEEFSDQARQAPRPAAQRRRRARHGGSPEAVPVLAMHDEEPLVRGHAAAARQALRGREEVGEDAWVREEIAATAW